MTRIGRTRSSASSWHDSDYRFSSRLDKKLTDTFLDYVLFVLRFDAKLGDASLFKSEDVMPQRTPSRAWFHNVRDLHERSAKTVEPSATVAAPWTLGEKKNAPPAPGPRERPVNANDSCSLISQFTRIHSSRRLVRDLYSHRLGPAKAAAVFRGL